MTVETVTKEMLMGLKVGQTEIYVLPDADKILSVRSTASNLKTFKGMEFKTTSDVPNRTISVTRIK